MQKYISKYKVTFGTLGTESPESGAFLIPLVPGTRFPDPGTIGTGSWNLGTLEPMQTSEPIRTGSRNLGTGTLEPMQTSEPWNRFLEPPALELILTLELVPGTSSPGTYPNLETLEPIQTSEPIGTGSRNGSWECGFWNLATLEPVPGTSSPGTYPTLEPVPGTSSPGTYPNLGTLEPVPGTSGPTGSRNGSRNVPGTGFFPGTAPARPAHTEIYIVQRPHSILLLGKNMYHKNNHL